MAAFTDLPREIRDMVYEEILIYKEVNIIIIDRDEAMGMIWAARNYKFRINPRLYSSDPPPKDKVYSRWRLPFNQIANLKSLCIKTTDDKCYYPFFLDGMKAHEEYGKRILSLFKEPTGRMLEGGDGLGEEGISSKVIAYGYGCGRNRTIITVANGKDAVLEKFWKYGDEFEKREEKLDRLIQEARLRIEKGRCEG